MLHRSSRTLFTLLATAVLGFADDAPAGPAGKLAFMIPTLYGSAGLTLPNPDHEAHFDSDFQRSFGPFNTAIASQLSSLPIPSPASGFTYTFDRSLGAYSRSALSFGPILAERAETIGKDRFAFGFSQQSFGFDRIDGVDLSRVPVVFQHSPSANTTFARDVITTDNFLDIRIAQTTAYFTYGVADRVDVSVALPYVQASLNVASDAVIRRIGTGANTSVHYFQGTTADRSRQRFPAAGSARGLGDAVLRVKGTALKGSRVSLALGMDTRLPTGDEYDFLGSGAVGLKPFMALSFRVGRVSPHVNAGYQWNGDSVLAGNVMTGETRRLPAQLSYVAGFDAGLTKRFTVALDLLGQRMTNAERVERRTFQAAEGVSFPQVVFRRGTLSQTSAAMGFKVNPVGDLLLSFNMLLALDDNGLRDRITPLIGLSYAF